MPGTPGDSEQPFRTSETAGDDQCNRRSRAFSAAEGCCCKFALRGAMELLAQLKNEDDNPRGQQQGRFVSGATLEEAAAAETRRAEIKAAKKEL